MLLICVCCAVAACRGQASGGDDSGTGGGDAGMGGDGGGTTRPGAGQDGGAGDAGLAIDAGRPVPRGAPVPGCADAGDPALTASERTLLSLPADSWFEAPGSHLFDTCGPAATYGDGVYLT